jgi:hypothetical protein
MDASEFSPQRAYRGSLIRLQSETGADGRWIPKCSIIYTTREGHAAAHRISFDERTANTLELANGLAFELAKHWIDRNADAF